ncbi:MAG: prepilin-type N-terminal cleavage/methylation domain-containing protein [Rubrivivax sp.]|nr:prepilin-type N-terminal cleavage/methylation domain-containing protein [Rubrivivax sp.]
MSPTRRPARQRGFGLVEMMVALALGLLVVGGASMLFIATRQANGTTDNLGRVQESVRTSYDLMTREVREAGGTPCDAQLLVADVLNNAQGGAPTWWATWGEPLRGYDNATAFPGAAFGAAVGERVAGTSALIVRYGAALDTLAVTAHDTATATFTVNRVAHGVAVDDLIMACNYSWGAVFNVSAVAASTFTHAAGAAVDGNCSVGLGLPTVCANPGTTYQFSAGSLVGRFTAAGWYIGNNGRPETGGRSLYRVTRRGVEEVAEGVRAMEMSYLVSGNADYVASAAVADWSQVTAVRFDLTFESPETGVATTGAGQRLTRTVAFTVNLRNMQP